MRLNRNQLAEELNVFPWDVDDWLLGGCPAEKLLSQWIFEAEAVRNWLKENRIKVNPKIKPKPAVARFDPSWLGPRCPRCTEKGFGGEKAGLLTTLGEIIMGQWCFRKVGFPCGHSIEIIP